MSESVPRTNGNWSHVEVHLDSLKRLERDIRITSPVVVAVSRWMTKNLEGTGQKHRYRYWPVSSVDWDGCFGNWI